MLKTTLTTTLSLILVLDSNLPVVGLEPIIALVIGLSIRFTFNWSNNTITAKNCLQRFIYAVALSYLTLFVWRDWEFQSNVIYTIAGIAVISAEIVNEGTKIIEMKFKDYFKRLINNITAKDDRI